MATNEHKSWRESREEILKRIEQLEKANSALRDQVYRLTALALIDDDQIDSHIAPDAEHWHDEYREGYEGRIKPTQNMTGGDWRPNQGANDDEIAVLKSLPTPLGDYTLSDEDISSLMSASAEELNGEEAQDERGTSKVSDRVGDSVGSVGNTRSDDDDVGAIMGELRVNVETIFSDALYDEKPYEKCYRQYAERVMMYVRPIIKRLVGERDSNLWKLKYDDMKNAKEREWAVAQDAIEAKERAEAERDTAIAGHLVDNTFQHAVERAERAEAERDAMRECVEVLREFRATNSIVIEQWRNKALQALAKLDEAQKGGGE